MSTDVTIAVTTVVSTAVTVAVSTAVIVAVSTVMSICTTIVFHPEADKIIITMIITPEIKMVIFAVVRVEIIFLKTSLAKVGAFLTWNVWIMNGNA
jgi:hypothetical protein